MQGPPRDNARPLRGTHDVGEIVGHSYRLFVANFAPLFAIALLTVPLQLLIGVITQSSDSDAAATAANLLQLPQALVSLVITGALVHEIHRLTASEPASFNGGLDAAFERFGALFKTGLLLAGLALASVFAAPFLAIFWLAKRDATIDGRRDWFLAIVPIALTIYLAVRWSFNTQAVMIADKRHWAALDDSADAVRGSWWRVLGIMLVVGLIVMGPSMLAQLAVFLPPLAASAIIAGVSALVVPFVVIAQTLLYYDLKTRGAAIAAATRAESAVEPTLQEEGAPE